MMAKSLLVATLAMLVTGCQSDVQVLLGKNNRLSFSTAEKQGVTTNCKQAQRRSLTRFALRLSDHVRLSIDSVTVECQI